MEKFKKVLILLLLIIFSSQSFIYGFPQRNSILRPPMKFNESMKGPARVEENENKIPLNFRLKRTDEKLTVIKLKDKDGIL